MQLSILKVPCRVLLKSVIIPIVLSFVAMSFIKALMYVPFDTVHLNLNIVLSFKYFISSINSIFFISTSLLGSSTSSLALAYSYNFFPFTFTAEYMGTS